VAIVKESAAAETPAAASSSSTPAPPTSTPTIGFTGRSGSTKSKLESKTEVPFPTLPTGAGKIDANAPKTFSTTASGFKYRMLRNGKGAAPGAGKVLKVHILTWSDSSNKSSDTNTYTSGPIPLPFDALKEQPLSADLLEVLMLMKVGGMIEVENTVKYPGGTAPPGALPAGTKAHMVLELLEVQ
jgi:hypothetical protein